MYMHAYMDTFVRTYICTMDKTDMHGIFLLDGSYLLLRTTTNGALIQKAVGIIIRDTATAWHTSWLCITPQDCSFRARCTTTGSLRSCHSSGQR